MVPFPPPAPFAPVVGSSEDTDVIVERIAALPSGGPVIGLEQVQDIVEAHHIDGLFVTLFRESGGNEAACRFAGRRIERLEWNALARLGDVMPIEPFEIVVAKRRLGALLGRELGQEALRRFSHPRARAALVAVLGGD